MLFKEGTPLYSYETIRESGENVMYINYLGASFVPSLSAYPEVMARTIDALSENLDISRIVFVQQRNYSYDFEFVKMLADIANLYNFLTKQEKILSQEKLQFAADRFSEIYNMMNYLISTLLKQDPVKAYREIKNLLFKEKADIGRRGGSETYVRFLEKLISYFDNLVLIKKAKTLFANYPVGDREIYEGIFRADVMPNFTFTRMVSEIPSEVEIIDQYEIASGADKSVVTIYKQKDAAKLIYHLSPPEYSLSEDHHMLLNLARNVLVEHQPRQEEFSDSERTRQVFFNVSRDLVQDLANTKNISLTYQELNNLANILLRHTIGFGVIEVLLQDENLQDIVINAPVSLSRIFVKHQEFDECSTNLVVSQEDADSWAAKFRMLSGRALDEANPILDTSLNLKEIDARIAIVQRPLSAGGLAYAIRRHRSNPWTLPLFIKNKMLDGLSAGLLSFLIDGGRTMLVAGTRSSGKTSLLGSLLFEIMTKFRVITVEDTLELPVADLRKEGYDILSMKVRSALTGESTEVSAEEGIRASLRLGDSALILGEIRSEEAKALYEAMRVGALANVVAGTIHGASPYAVFDRVVNDLEVPATSFKATDVIGICNPVKSSDGLHSWRRVMQLAEVRKHWKQDPVDEKGFVDLLKYNVEKDELEPTEDLINGDIEVIKDIAANVKGWAGNWDAVYDDILLRAKIKKEVVEVAEKIGNDRILECEFNTLSNHAFHRISDDIRQEIGLPLSERVFPEWQKWLMQEVKGRKI